MIDVTHRALVVRADRPLPDGLGPVHDVELDVATEDLPAAFAEVRRWAERGHVVGVRLVGIGLDGVGPDPAAVVTAAMSAGARVLVVPDDRTERIARRAADVTAALLEERAG